MKRYPLLILAICSLIVASAFAESHHWDSIDGKFAIDGELLRVEKTECVIRTDDGREISVGFGQLSLSDLAYAADWENGTLPQPPAPKPPMTPPPAAAPSSGFTPPRSPSRSTSAMRPSAPAMPPSDVTPPSSPAAEMPQPEPEPKPDVDTPDSPWKSLPIAGKSLVAPIAVSPWVMQFEQGAASIFDLRKPDAPIRKFDFGAGSKLAAISPHGKWIAATASDNSGLSLVELSAAMTPRVVKIPNAHTPKELLFAGDDWLLLVDGDGASSEIIGVDVAKGSVAWRMNASMKSLVVSPSGKWFTPFALTGDLPVHDCQTGEQAFRMKAPQPRTCGAYSADDKFLVTADTESAEFIMVHYDLRKKASQFTKWSQKPPASVKEPLGSYLQWPDSDGPVFFGAKAMLAGKPLAEFEEVAWPAGVKITGPVRFRSPTQAFGFTETKGYVNYAEP